VANFIPKIEYIEKFTGIAKVIEFDFPPDADPVQEQLRISSVVTRSNNGTVQTQFNNIKTEQTHNFIFVSQTLTDLVRDMIVNHAALGGSVNYFESKDEVDFVTVKYTEKRFKVQRDLADGNGDFLYRFKLKFERKIK
jgi:hypothetical protein